jgi:hypothetical protein
MTREKMYDALTQMGKYFEECAGLSKHIFERRQFREWDEATAQIMAYMMELEKQIVTLKAREVSHND